MRHIGKIGRLNQIARSVIAQQAEAMNLTTCEIRFPGCEGSIGIAPAHKHPREWYRTVPELLSNRGQWRAACQHCHAILDDRSKTTKAESDAFFE